LGISWNKVESKRLRGLLFLGDIKRKWFSETHPPIFIPF
jgi:hypothetical protein